jgi:hypothetical protein
VLLRATGQKLWSPVVVVTVFGDVCRPGRPVQIRCSPTQPLGGARSGSLGASGATPAAVTSALEARRLGLRGLVLAHLGRPTLRAVDADELPPFGEFGEEARR